MRKGEATELFAQEKITAQTLSSLVALMLLSSLRPCQRMT